MNWQFQAQDEAAMVAWGRALAASTAGELTLFLIGNLGMGKTTFCRGVLQHFGHQGAVKSPTYTLVEPYDMATGVVYHFDLYRLADPEELEYLGIRDYFDHPALRLIEWPNKGEGVLPGPDLQIEIERLGEGRQLSCSSFTPRGAAVLERLAAAASAKHLTNQ
ncbi:MAG TPA: tRNA (adenosine(37)-N6)-threonylcarbamoyltransferase complex ATPase subunit type 1 TsaE [Motiliproteus sp.]